ncbi:hypothetical protein, partial [Streptomyces prunicolor]|uniref:hypothetical protein n=1 Tax=Streptomyces prunicolor TaxID=67348 RepID=UPI00342C679E
GLVIVARIDHRDRTDVDRQLAARVEKGDQDAMGAQPPGTPAPTRPSRPATPDREKTVGAKPRLRPAR